MIIFVKNYDLIFVSAEMDLCVMIFVKNKVVVVICKARAILRGYSVQRKAAVCERKYCSCCCCVQGGEN